MRFGIHLAHLCAVTEQTLPIERHPLISIGSLMHPEPVHLARIPIERWLCVVFRLAGVLAFLGCQPLAKPCLIFRRERPYHCQSVCKCHICHVVDSFPYKSSQCLAMFVTLPAGPSAAPWPPAGRPCQSPR